jgi:DNA-3-methyladenine glycosylase II
LRFLQGEIYSTHLALLRSISTKLIIPLPADYNVGYNFQFLRRSPREILHVFEGERVYKLIRITGKNFLIAITPGNGMFEIEFLNDVPDETGQSVIVKYIREWFDLDADLSPFYELAAKDNVLAPVVRKFSGYRIVGQPDLFESLVWAVIGQQINLQFAYTLKERFVSNFGERVSWGEKIFYAFPLPESVVDLSHNDLSPLQFSAQKSKYVQLIAEAFVHGVISKEKLSALSFEDAKNTLMKIKGVGNWTANYALMKTFRFPNAFPLEDAGIHNAMRRLKNMDRKPTLEEVRRFFRRYKGWEAYATLYLWKSLELQ